MINIRRLTPFKTAALQVLAVGPLTLTPDVGWRPESGGQVFNSHTVLWLAAQEWAVLNGDRTTAHGIDERAGALA